MYRDDAVKSSNRRGVLPIVRYHASAGRERSTWRDRSPQTSSASTIVHDDVFESAASADKWYSESPQSNRPCLEPYFSPAGSLPHPPSTIHGEIGRASCRERV